MNTNHESVAYRSFSPSKFEARGARKVTTGEKVPELLEGVRANIYSRDNWLVAAKRS